MVAVAQFIPDDPREKDSVLAVLAELEPFITEVSEDAHRRFPEVRIELDTLGYDEWDPPLRMLVYVTQPWTSYWETVDGFTQVVRDNPHYNRDLIFVMPRWAGPIETAPQPKDGIFFRSQVS